MLEPVDPIPIDFLSLDRAVQCLADKISKRETTRVSFEHQGHEDAIFAVTSTDAWHPWNQRRIACKELKAALTSGAIEGLYLDRSRSQLMKLEKNDWRQVAFFDEILRGGVVRASIGEPIARAEGRRVLLRDEAFAKWLRIRSPRRPAAVRKRCTEWLENIMSGGPKIKSKRTYREEAFNLFGISGRDFKQIWRTCVEKNSDWGRPGRPRSSKL